MLILQDLIAKIGWLGYPLLLCSSVSGWIIIAKSIFWIQYHRGLKTTALKHCSQALNTGDIIAAKTYAQSTSHPILTVVVAGLTAPKARQSDTLAYACAREIRAMNRYANALTLIITVSPMLGILGTIIGIIQAFQGISADFEPTSMIAGISMALWTTAIGLSITIVTLLPYYFFVSQTNKATHQLEDWATQVEHAT